MNELPAIVVHCDWSVEQGKRWMACAVRNGNLWELKQPELVGTTKDLFQRLQNRKKTPGCLFVGLDFPIGLPKYYGEKNRIL